VLQHKAVQFTPSDRLVFEDSHQYEKSSPAVTNPFLQTDDVSPKDETFAVDSPWEEDAQIDVVNYTLASDLAVSEAGSREAVTGTGPEGFVDATADITKFPSKNDL